MCIFYYDDNFVNQMMFSVNMVNTKVVYNLLILLVLKFHDLSPVGLGVIDFRSCCQGLHVVWKDLNDCIVWLI